MPKLFRLTTVPISLRLLLTGQMRYMHEHGFEVIMVSANGPEREAVIKAEGCPHIIVPMTRAITPWQDLRCLLQLIRLFRREQPDIVHTHTPKAGLLGMLAAWWTDVPLRIHTVAGLPLMTATGFRRRLLGWTERLTYAAAHQVWPNSRSLYEFIVEQGYTRPDKLAVIGQGSSNGIDLSRFSPQAIEPQQTASIKRILDYNRAFTYLLAVGRVVRDKGIIELVEVFQQLKTKRPFLKLILLGPLERERAEESLPADTLAVLEEDPDILHINWSDQVEYYMHLADLFIHASHREGFPNVLLQAGAMKCPNICSDIPGNTDIVVNGESGLLFEAKNAAALQDKLVYALDHPQKMQEMATRLRRRIEENFRREELQVKMLEKYMDLLEITHRI